MTATVINPMTITHKWKLSIQKEIEEYKGEISILDKMSKSFKVKKQEKLKENRR